MGIGNNEKAKEIEALEAKLDLKIPVFYREILANFPKEIRERAPLELDDDEQEVGGCLMILESLAMLEDLNLEFRDLLTNEAELSEWFATGSDGCGNYYLISTKGDGDKIFFFDHEEGEISPRFSSAKAYIAECCDALDSESDPEY